MRATDPTDAIRRAAANLIVGLGGSDELHIACDRLDAKFAALVEACEALAEEVEWKMDPDKEACDTQAFYSVGDVLEFARTALRAAKGEA